MARPIPEAAPVTMATRPSSFMVMFISLRAEVKFNLNTLNTRPDSGNNALADPVFLFRDRRELGEGGRPKFESQPRPLGQRDLAIHHLDFFFHKLSAQIWNRLQEKAGLR